MSRQSLLDETLVSVLDKAVSSCIRECKEAIESLIKINLPLQPVRAGLPQLMSALQQSSNQVFDF